MDCQLCGKRPASIHYTELSGSVSSEYHICQECAQEKGLFKSPGSTGKLSLNELLGGAVSAGSSADPAVAGLACATCGLTFAEFREQGRLGCGECYAAFAEPLRPLLRRIHGATEHRGKAPPGSPTPVAATAGRELRRLREELRRALEREDFERCAELRDRIREVGGTPEAS
jgi:protein arginine kinase activator